MASAANDVKEPAVIQIAGEYKQHWVIDAELLADATSDAAEKVVGCAC